MRNFGPKHRSWYMYQHGIYFICLKTMTKYQTLPAVELLQINTSISFFDTNNFELK